MLSQYLQKKAEHILTEVENTVREIREFNHPTIRLGLPPIIGGYYAAGIMKQIDDQGLLPFINLVEDGSELLMKKSKTISLIWRSSARPRLSKTARSSASPSRAQSL
ncbi:hypothetical protein QKW52_03720 [Bacillus sonorensis]|nr:hypothetical protein [Bacillus sonorensis]